MTQPTTQALLDTGNPFYGNMFYAQGMGLWDARNGAMLAKTGPGGVVSEGGANLVESAGPTGGTIYTLAAPLVTVGAITVLVKARGADVGVIYGNLFGADDLDCSLGFGGAVKKISLRLPLTAGGLSAYGINLPGNNYDLATYAFTVTPTGTVTFYVNGTSLDSYEAGGSVSLRITEIMDGYGGTGYSLKGVLEYLTIIPAVCTPEQIASLTTEPYQSLVGFVSTVTAPAATLVGDGLLYASGADNGSVTVLVAANEINISLPSGSETNYPYQFGRPFRKGEIVDTPQVLLDGVPLTTQADVKTRHRDGSVKFAVISVVLPTLSTTNRVITFQNQAAPVVTPVSIASMLADYDFEAKIDIKSGGSSLVGAPISARAMLATLSDAQLLATTNAQGVNSRFWTVGQICTTLILCDHTTKAWDVGTDSQKAIRPVFHVQFWPGINQYKVRLITEVADVTKLKHELGLNIIFSTGFSSPVERLNNTQTLWMCSWQSREYWKGAGKPRLNAKHGVAYLSECGVVANHDPSIVMNASAITSYHDTWLTYPKALGSWGFWQKGMDSTGGRQDLGLMPKWDNVALYSGDARMYEVCDESAEMAGSWSMFLREGASTKTIYGSTVGQGRIISKLSRPTLMFPQMGYTNNGDVADRLSLDYSGSFGSQDGWIVDDAHTPGVFWFQYITQGSYFWQEKLTQMAAHSQFSVNPAPQWGANGRNNTDCVLWNQQTRATGWQYRNRSRAWWAAVDGSSEKKLADRWLSDPTAALCGAHGIDAFVGDPIREGWNANYVACMPGQITTLRPNGMHIYLNTVPSDPVTNPYGTWPTDSRQSGYPLWMTDYIIMGISTAIDLGYSDATPLRDWLIEAKIQIALSSQPRHIADYIFPYGKNDGTFYQSIDEILSSWPGGTPTADYPQTMSIGVDGSHYLIAGGTIGTWNVSMPGYGSVAIAAIAMCNGRSQQAEAWAVVEPWHVAGATAGVSYYDHDPTWAIIPRVAAGTVVPPEGGEVVATGVVLTGLGMLYAGRASNGEGTVIYVKTAAGYVPISAFVKTATGYKSAQASVKASNGYH